MTEPMRGFFRFSVLYLTVMLVIVFLLRDQPLLFIKNTLYTPLSYLSVLKGTAPMFFSLLVLVAFVGRADVWRDTLAGVGYALLGSLIFTFSFAGIKPSMVLIWPLFADPFFAELDKALHFGVDPWKLTHRFSGLLPAEILPLIYIRIWVVLAFSFPSLVALTDRNVGRVSRFMLIYVFVWVGLGNVLALAGLSAGPVFYDQYVGSDYFAGLNIALQSSGVSDTMLGNVQRGLWSALVETRQMSGTGISAFPSVHVGIAAMLAAYGWERHWVIGVVGWVYCAIILFLSVYLGWHYAVDGYFSILAVLLVWRLGVALPFSQPASMRRRAPELQASIGD